MSVESETLPAPVTEAIKRLQVLLGQTPSGIMDEETKTFVKQTLQSAVGTYLSNHSPDITLPGGARYLLKPNGDIHEWVNGKYEPTKKANVLADPDPVAAEILAAVTRDELKTLTPPQLAQVLDGQRRIALRMAATESEAATLLDTIRKSPSLPEAQKSLFTPRASDNFAPLKDDQRSNDLLVYLWQLELSSRALQAGHIPADAANNADLKKTAAVTDTVHGLANGEPSGFLKQIAPADNELPMPNDSFFSEEVYRLLETDVDEMPTIDGKLISPAYEGQQLTRQQVYQIALERFEERAQREGIPLHDVSKAMFEGRYNPRFEDVEFAFRGLNPGEAYYDTQEWNRRYGSLADMGTVNTRITNGRYTDENYQVSEINMTSDQVLERLRQRVHEDDPARIAQLGTLYSAYTYFSCRDTGEGSHHLKRDYADLRREYYKRLQQREAGIDPTDVADILRRAERVPSNSAATPEIKYNEYRQNAAETCVPPTIVVLPDGTHAVRFNEMPPTGPEEKAIHDMPPATKSEEFRTEGAAACKPPTVTVINGMTGVTFETSATIVREQRASQ